MKTGDSTTLKKKQIKIYHNLTKLVMKKITLDEKEDRHKVKFTLLILRTPKENMGITWSNESKRTKNLKEFYFKTHVYTWVSEGNKESMGSCSGNFSI